MGNVEGAAQAIADALAPTQPSPSARWRWGTVVSVQDDGTITAAVGGTTVAGIRASQQAMGAAAGDRVRICYIGTEAFADSLRASSKLIRLPSIEAGSLALGSPLTIPNGGTGATTAEGAWDALGGGDIGKKNSLAASDIPSLDYTTVNSSAALVDAGRNAKTITAQYSGNAVAATDYVTMWGNYKLVAVTIASLWSKLVSTIGTTSKLNNSNATIYIWGKLVMVQLHGQTKAPDGTAIWSTAYLADYKPGYNVSAIVAATSGELARVWVSADNGKIYLNAVNTSSSNAWYGTLVYMLS